MAKGSFEVRTTPIDQPEIGSTRKGQKRLRQPADYDPETINSELDYVHERINQITYEAAALTDLSGSATLADTITRVNALAEILRQAGLLKSS
jgi:hypothetical protein